MARANEYDSTGRIVLRDTEGTIISFYRFMQLSLGPNSHPWAPPWYWGGYAGHQGYDLGAPAYSEVRSLCTGKVVIVRGVNDGDGTMGNSVCIEETGQPVGATVRTHRYMHFAEYPSVALGDIVEQGTLLGYVGQTGQADGNHLHYDVTTGGPWGPKIDAWDQYNHSSEPAGWTPQAITDASGSPWGTSLSWDVIGETTGINYGPGEPGGQVPKTFSTSKPVYDINWADSASLGSFTVNNTGGLLLKVGEINAGSDTINNLTTFKQYLTRYQNVIPLGFCFQVYVSATTNETEAKRRFTLILDALNQEGVTPELAEIGLWVMLTDESGATSSNKDNNFKQVDWCRQVFAAEGYPTVGLYTTPEFISNYLPVAKCADTPLWIKVWLTEDGTTTAADKSSLSTYMDTTLYNALHNNIFLWQDGVTSFPHGFIDHNWVFQPILNVGYVDDPNKPIYPSDIGIPELMAANKIYFEPDPGVIIKNTKLKIGTNVSNVVISYTLDNSVPQYITEPVSLQMLAAYEYLPATKEHQNLFIRVRAYDKETKVLKAQGAACYVCEWDRPKPQAEELIIDEVNRRPYLKYELPNEV